MESYPWSCQLDTDYNYHVSHGYYISGVSFVHFMSSWGCLEGSAGLNWCCFSVAFCFLNLYYGSEHLFYLLLFWEIRMIHIILIVLLSWREVNWILSFCSCPIDCYRILSRVQVFQHGSSCERSRSMWSYAKHLWSMLEFGHGILHVKDAKDFSSVPFIVEKW